MNTQERALEKAKSKVEELMWATPEGLTISEITGDLRISVALAKTALKAIGAVYEGGVWVLHDDDVAPVAVAPAIGNADTSPAPVAQPVAKSETGIPVSEEKQAVEPESKTVKVVRAEPDWANAPEGATHYHQGEFIRWTGKKDSYGFFALDAYDPEGWTETAYSWTGTLDSFLANDAIPRPKTCQDTCTAHICSVDDACFIASRDAAEPIKSDYAIAMDIEREQVLTVIKTGATLSRIAEITGLHIDDAQHHVDVLIDLGRIVARPVVVVTAYEVVA
jgi:hypothetical protein